VLNGVAGTIVLGKLNKPSSAYWWCDLKSDWCVVRVWDLDLLSSSLPSNTPSGLVKPCPIGLSYDEPVSVALYLLEPAYMHVLVKMIVHGTQVFF
jgi:hypothetical protein